LPVPPESLRPLRPQRDPGGTEVSGVTCDLEPDSPVLMVTFGGRGGRRGPLAAALDASVPVKTVQFVDHASAWYHRGVAGVGTDVGAVGRWLRDVSDGAPRVVVGGVSAGGYAALLFGALLGAEVHAFSPQTLLAAQGVTGLDGRYGDLRPVLAAGEGRFHVYYSANAPAETEHAERIADLPHVVLHRVDDTGGGVFKTLHRRLWVRMFVYALVTDTEIPAP
jgi:hypothetical protein